MFRGHHEHSIDEKGRTSIPSKFREVLQKKYEDERLIITNFDHCLWAYPLKEWHEIEKKVSNLPQFKKEVKALQRLFISAASECPIDKQGRILIPETLRQYAGLERDLIVVGMSNRIEIWDKMRWKNEYQKAQENLEGIGETLAGFGI